MWPWSKEPEPKVPMRGVKLAGIKIDAPPPHAPTGMWIDFSALCGLIPMRTPQHWQENAASDYLKKWHSFLE